MGFKPKRNQYRLAFEDPELEGLQVVMRSLTIEQFLKLTGLSSEAKAENASSAEDLFRMFSRALVSWNIEDDEGNPVPATLEGVQSQELNFIFGIVSAWMEAMTTVSPKEQPRLSNGGQSAQESTLDLASLSASLKS